MRRIVNGLLILSVIAIIMVFIFVSDRNPSLEWILSIMLLILTAVFIYANRRTNRE